MTDAPRLHRRALLATGAGVVTSAGMLTFEPAAAGSSRTKVFKGRFDDPNTPDWHYLPFRVPKGARAIEVDYSFTPTDSGLGFSSNVVDIGIFGPAGHDLGNAKGFRGWSGGARRHFHLSRSHATPGYLPGPIDPGTWHIALGPYLITPTGTPYRVEVTVHFGKPGAAFHPKAPPTSVPGKGPGWYRGDLHTHTLHSDGSRREAVLQDAARAAGLDFLGSSEHNTCTATQVWGKHVDPDFLVVCGEEVTTRNGHWGAMGIPAGTWIDWRYRAADNELQHFTDLVRSLGGFAIANHPFIPLTGNKWDFGYDYLEMDAVEVWNGPWSNDDQACLTSWERMLRGGRYVPLLGNSDSHNPTQTVGLPHTVVRAGSLSTPDLVAAYKAGHSWIAESKDVALTFEASLGDTTAECGDTLTATSADQVAVSLVAHGVPGCVAQVLGPTGVLAGAIAGADGNATVETTVPAATTAYVRAEVRRPDGEVKSPTDGLTGATMVALTNPVFISASA